jgi:phosphoserine phosphatase
MSSNVGQAHGWPEVSSEAADLPVAFMDLDGTLRGDALPMVKLALPYVPNFASKVRLKEPIRAKKAVQFGWNLARLWTLRTLHHEQRRRYKRLFSELHHLSAALLSGFEVDEVRELFRRRAQQVKGIWFDNAVDLLDKLSKSCLVVLVTGSEQIQTQECVKMLARRGIRTDRLLVFGSLYEICDGRFSGKVRHLNVTLEAKRDAVRQFTGSGMRRIAFGNSRPDRALFEAIDPSGLLVLVCPKSVVRKRKSRTFTIRKFERSGFKVHWTTVEYLDSLEDYLASQESCPRPILATDREFQNVIKKISTMNQYILPNQ